MKKSILILAGPSAVGKTTVMDRIIGSDGRFTLIRSATTRAPRGDVHDGEYIYLSRDEFISRINRGEMLEYMEYAGNLYGTPASEIEEVFSQGKIPLLILDLVGVRNIRERKTDYRVVSVYIYSSLSTIKDRLYKRCENEGHSENALLAYQKRAEQNIKDYVSLPDYFYLFDAFVENVEVDATAQEVISLFFSEETADRSLQSKNISDALSDEAKRILTE